jgi:CRISPR-associated protein Cas2
VQANGFVLNMLEERLYIVTYDISDDRRWRRVFKLMKGYGRWLQLSVFQCRLTAKRRAEMARRLEELIRAEADHVLILDLGPADKVDPRVESLGKTYESVKRTATVI